MYFPYLRGKTYELKALRELVENDLLGDKIIPIVEPINMSSSLTKLVSTFVEHKKRVGIVINPLVGTFLEDFYGAEEEEKKKFTDKLFNNEYAFFVHIINENSKIQFDAMFQNGVTYDKLIVINNDKINYPIYLNLFQKTPPAFTLVPNIKNIFRTVRRNAVIFEDYFIKQRRNQDYAIRTVDFFSDDHLFFSAQGYEGFSDYSIIGDQFVDGGFAPFAVAIHLVFADNNNNNNNNNVLMVKHFVSDTNDDITNQPLKIYEALAKIYEDKDIFIPTYGLQYLLDLYTNERSTSLGGLKKYSIMHHLETVAKLLN